MAASFEPEMDDPVVVQAEVFDAAGVRTEVGADFVEGPLDAALRSGRPMVLTAWHQDVLLLFHYLITFTAFEQRQPWIMLASRSFDGEITERLLRPWGFRFVRGSFGKQGGRSALRGLLRATEEGRSALVIADGPLPPPYVMRPGPVFLARASGLPLYAVRAWARPQTLVPNTWFRLAIPVPRAHFALFSAGPIPVDDGVEAGRRRAEGELLRLCEEADARLYLRRSISGGVRLGDIPV